MINIDQSNIEKLFRIFPTSVDTTLLIGWFYHRRILNNGTVAIDQAIATSEPGPCLLVGTISLINLYVNLKTGSNWSTGE